MVGWLVQKLYTRTQIYLLTYRHRHTETMTTANTCCFKNKITKLNKYWIYLTKISYGNSRKHYRSREQFKLFRKIKYMILKPFRIKFLFCSKDQQKALTFENEAHSHRTILGHFFCHELYGQSGFIYQQNLYLFLEKLIFISIRLMVEVALSQVALSIHTFRRIIHRFQCVNSLH